MSTDRPDVTGAGFATAGACGPCGFPGASLAPGDAVAVLRDVPRLWRAALALDLDEADPEALLTQPATPGGWSALQHAGHVRDVLHALDIRIQRVLREDCPVLPETHLTPPAGANEQGAAVVLAALGVSADQLTRTIETSPPGSWSRTARRAGEPLSAIDLVCEAVHEAQHHLLEATAAIEELRSAARGSAPVGGAES